MHLNMDGVSAALCSCLKSACWQEKLANCCGCCKCADCQFSGDFSTAFRGECCCDEFGTTTPATFMPTKRRIKLVFKRQAS